MLHWIAVGCLCLLAICVAAQDGPTNTVFFLARTDTDQDGQVTDADNMRLYQVALDGTVLFVTPPQEHVLLDAVNSDITSPIMAAVLVQMPDNTLEIQFLGGDLAPLPLNTMAVVTDVHFVGSTLVWQGRTYLSDEQAWVYDLMTHDISRLDSVPPPSSDDLQPMMIDGEPFLLQQPLGNDLLIVQHLDVDSADALWIYDKTEKRLTPFNAWLFVEPLLIATHSLGPRLAVLGREFDGTMSLSTVDFSASVAMPSVTQILSGLINPPYMAMQWTRDGSQLLLVGDSGDFVVSSIGRIEAVYALDIGTGAFMRLSPEASLVERNSITTR